MMGKYHKVGRSWRHQLLDLGLNTDLLWCPDCGEVKSKAQFTRALVHGGPVTKAHSTKCPSAMVRVNVTLEPVS